MQTFLPYRDFRRSARALDIRRLGKQRVETLQILRALTFDDYGWRNHPAVLMWAGFTPALVTYGAAVTHEWQRAGFADTVLPQLLEFLDSQPLRTQRELAVAGLLPPWLGHRPLHRSHQAALLRKDPQHYGPLFGSVDPQLPYVWPQVDAVAARPLPISGWVVRVTADTLPTLLARRVVGVEAQGEEGVGAPAGPGTRSTKRRRQIEAFAGEIRRGDRVVVPDGDTLHLAKVTGGYQWREDAEVGPHHVRRVRWLTAVHRTDLRRPVHLQDPRVVFPLRGEPLLDALG